MTAPEASDGAGHEWIHGNGPTTVLKDRTLDTRGVLVHLMSGESILIYLWASWSLEQPCGNALL